MKKIFDHLTEFVGIVLTLVLVALWFNGAYHGSRRHDTKPFEDVFGFFQCIYYGAERFWHPLDKDELNESIKLGVSICYENSSFGNSTEKLDYFKAKKYFKKTIGKYNSEETNYVRSGIETFLDFFNNLNNDLVDNLKRKSKQFLISPETKKLKEKCMLYSLNDDVKTLTDLYGIFIKEDLIKQGPGKNFTEYSSLKKIDSNLKATFKKAKLNIKSLFLNN